MPIRTVEDLLREEYFELLPDLKRIAYHFEAEIKFHLLPVVSTLAKFEQINVVCRIKKCESAIDALRRRQPGKLFDRDERAKYSLVKLKNLVAARVLAFPVSRLQDVLLKMQNVFPFWNEDPVMIGGRNYAHKFWGHTSLHSGIYAEYQVTSMLTGLFWQVEHDAIYKPSPASKGIDRALAMQTKINAVFEALHEFDVEFQRLISTPDQAE